jgi:hypothetical protein
MPMKRFSLALLLALTAAACGDGGGPTQQSQTVDRVYVTPSQANLNAGETVQLAAQARDDENAVVAGTVFTWVTLDPGVAGVNTAGLVTALTGGTARIVAAAANGVADTALVTVLSVATECSSTGSAPQLAVGDSLTLRGAAAALLCLDGQSTGAEYVIMPFYGTTQQSATLGVRMTPSGVRAVAGPPLPSLAPSFSVGGVPGANDGGFHTRLNERARGHLGTLVPGARAAQRTRSGGARMALQQTTPAVGSLLQLNVSTKSDNTGNPCVITDFRTGRIEAVGSRAVIVADTANPKGGFTAEDYQNFAATFDTLIYPVNAQAFGEPQDIDGNGRVIIFYTRAVNELTPANVNYIVGGYFYGRDLFPKVASQGFPACPGSNSSEMFYMLAPDPSGEVNGNARTTAYVRNSTLGVVGHEFQHLISASRRLYVVEGVSDLAWNEDAFLNEGLSHIAEELLFYHRAQLAPRMNLGGPIMDQARTANAFNEFQRSNYNRFGQYLQNPDEDSPYDRAFGEEDDLATRGAAWGFLRWAADQRAGNDLTLWYNLVNNNEVGLANLEKNLGTNPVELFRQFSVGLYTDDAVVPTPTVFTHPSWNYRSLYARVSNGFPLEVTSLVSGTPASSTLVAGGIAYRRAGVNAGQKASIQVTVDGAAPPAALTVTIVRTK